MWKISRSAVKPILSESFIYDNVPKSLYAVSVTESAKVNLICTFTRFKYLKKKSFFSVFQANESNSWPKRINGDSSKYTRR